MESVSIPDDPNAAFEAKGTKNNSERHDISTNNVEYERKGDKRKVKENENNDEDVNSSEEIAGTRKRKLKKMEIMTLEVEDVAKYISKDSEEERLPDGGWGWMVVFGASLILILVDIIGQCFGVVFSRFLLQLETPTVTIAWIFNLFSFIWCLAGLPLGPLIIEFGWRKLTFIGSILLAIAVISSAFATAAWQLFFTFSLLAGIGCGMISNISYMIVPHYFSKQRGLANGIIMAWDCGGQLIAPSLIRILQDEYTYTGATLILGGIILNCCVGAAVFHPVEWHLKPQEIKHNIPSKASSGQASLQESHWEKFLRLLKSTLENLRILRSAKAVIIAVGSGLMFNGYLNFLAFVPFAMHEDGHSLEDAARCISVSAICNMISRVTVAAISDNKWFSFHITMMVGSLVISGTMLCFTFLHDLTLMTIVMGLWGCGVGTFMSIFSLSMVHYMGLNNLIPMLAACMLFVSVGYLTVGPLAGFVRDASQSYDTCIWLLAGVVFLNFILWLFMPVAMAYDLHRESKKNEDL